MYKDKDKQREAGRERARRYRENRQKALLSEGVTNKALPDGTMSIETLAMMDAGCGNKLDHGLKRGKDIKCFEDLPADVQRTIERLSDNPEEKRRRTGIAIHYQHLFPGRYYSTGA